MDPTVQLVIFRVVTTIVPLILFIAVHEYAHVAMARFLGDDTGTRQDRFTLNPLAHVDPIWTLAVPTYFVVAQTLGGGSGVPFFGAGKPAPYNPMRLDRKFNGKRISMRTGELLVAAAGPLSNLLLALICAALVFVFVRAGSDMADPRSLAQLGFNMVLVNTGLFFFNLIPIPPLDGSKVLMSLLPREAARRYEAIGQQLSLVLFIAVIFGARYFLAPAQNAVASLLFAVLF